MRVSNYQYLSLYGTAKERRHANMILNFFFKGDDKKHRERGNVGLVWQRKLNNRAIIRSNFISERPKTMTTDFIQTYQKAEMKKLMRDIRKKQSPVVHFIKGLNISQKEIHQFLTGSLEAVIFATFMVIFSAITLLLVPVIHLN